MPAAPRRHSFSSTEGDPILRDSIVRRTLILFILFIAALCGATAPSVAHALTIPANTWVRQPAPTQVLPPGRSGYFEARGWNNLRYDPTTSTMVLYDGYVESPDYATPNIYANSIWRYDLARNRLSLVKLNHWARTESGTVPFLANTSDPTPFDRHPYGCFNFVPSRNRAYLWSGANNSVKTGYIGDTWSFDFSSATWREIPTTSPFTVFEQSMSYDPFVDAIVLFGGASRSYGSGSTHLFDLETETWTDLEVAASPSPRFGQSVCFDPVRRVTWMFGGGDYGEAGRELWSFDAAAKAWTRVPESATWPESRRFAHMAYDTKRDRILMWGGITGSDEALTDTWAFDPAERTWQRLAPSIKPTGSIRTYSNGMDYDPVNDVFVLHLGGAFWLYRHAPEAGPGGDVGPTDPDGTTGGDTPDGDGDTTGGDGDTTGGDGDTGGGDGDTTGGDGDTTGGDGDTTGGDDTVDDDTRDQASDEAAASSEFQLRLLSANPAHHGAGIRFNLPRSTHVRLDLFDVFGRRVATLADAVYPAGSHTRQWSGQSPRGPVASGVYFVRFSSPDRVVTRRFVLVR